MSPLLKKGFDSAKCVSLLEVILQRIKILRNKRSVIVKQSRDDVAKLLQMGQDVNAAARVEYVFREANILAAYGLLEQYCQIITKGVKNIKSKKECSPELKEAITGLIYAAPRCGDLQELQKLRDLFTANFGSEFAASVLELRPDCGVSTQIAQYLSTRPPNTDVRLTILKDLASEYKINWNYQKAAAAIDKAKEASVSASGSQASSSSLCTTADKRSPTSVSTHEDPLKGQTVESKQDPIPSAAQQASSGPKEYSSSSRAPRLGRPSLGDTNVPPAFDKHQKQDSSASQNKTPSKVHDTGPRPHETEDANKVSDAAVENQKQHHAHEGRLNVKESYFTRKPHFPMKNRAVPKVDGVAVNPPPDGRHPKVADKERESMHQGRSKGQANSPYIPSSHESVSKEKVLTDTLGPCMPINPSHKDELKENTTSAASSVTPRGGKPLSRAAFYQGRMFSPQPPANPNANSVENHTTAPLAVGHEMRPQKEPSVASTSRREDQDRGVGIAVGDMRPTAKAWSPNYDPYTLSKQEGQIGKRNVEDAKDVCHEEDESSVYEYYAREHMIGTLLRTPSGGRRHDSKGKEEVQKPAFAPQLPYQQNKHTSKHSKDESHTSEQPKVHSRGAMDSLAQHEFMPTRKIKAEREFSDLKTATEAAILSATHAADAAKTAMDIVRQTSRKMVEALEDSTSGRRQASYGPVLNIRRETALANKQGKGFDNTGHYQEQEPVRSDLHQGKGFDNTGHYQEPVLSDLEIPHFDDYSSDGCTTEEPAMHNKSRVSVTGQDDGHIRKRGTTNQPNQQSKSNLHVRGGYDGINNKIWTIKKTSQQGFTMEEDAESVEILSPKSSTSSCQHTNSDTFGCQSNQEPQFDEYEEVMDMCADKPRVERRFGDWNNASDVHARHVYGGLHNLEWQRQRSALHKSEDHIGKTSAWHIQASNEPDDHEEVRWSSGTKEKPAGDLNIKLGRGADGSGKYQVLSRRSVRSTLRQT